MIYLVDVKKKKRPKKVSLIKETEQTRTSVSLPNLSPLKIWVV